MLTSQGMPDQFLANLSGFSANEQALIHQTLLECKTQKVAANTLLYTTHHAFSNIYLLLDGMARCYQYTTFKDESQEGNLRLLANPALLFPFNSVAPYFGRSIADNIPLPIVDEMIETVSACTLLKIPLSLILISSENINETLLYKIQAFIASQHYLAVAQRLKMLLIKTATERYDFYKSVMPEKILKEMPAYHVASYLGITPETLSRLKSQH